MLYRVKCLGHDTPGMILQWGSTIKVSIELPDATRHHRDIHVTESEVKPEQKKKKKKERKPIETYILCSSIFNQLFIALYLDYSRIEYFLATLQRHNFALKIDFNHRPLLVQNWDKNVKSTKQNGPRQANLVLIAYASSEGSGEPAHSRSLARTSAARSYK